MSQLILIAMSLPSSLKLIWQFMPKCLQAMRGVQVSQLWYLLHDKRYLGCQVCQVLELFWLVRRLVRADVVDLLSDVISYLWPRAKPLLQLLEYFI